MKIIKVIALVCCIGAISAFSDTFDTLTCGHWYGGTYTCTYHSGDSVYCNQCWYTDPVTLVQYCKDSAGECCDKTRKETLID
jgi:hypothetical protein